MTAIGKSLAEGFPTPHDSHTFAAKLKFMKRMNQPMIVWCTIVGVLLFAFVLRTAEKRHFKCHQKAGKHRRLIEIGKESEIFYVPGDAKEDDLRDA